MSRPAPPVPFASVRPGLAIPPVHVDVRDSTNARLCAAVGVPPAPGGAVTPALGGNLNIGLAFSVLPRDVLHVSQRIRCTGAATVGERLAVRGHVSEVGARRGRGYVSVAATITRAGAPVWETEAEFMVPAMRADTLPASERPALEVPAGASVVGSRTRRFTLGDMASFSGRGNFHSDREVAASYGYAAPLAQGMHVAAVGFALLDEVRPGWSAGAEIELRFVGETPEGSVVTVETLAGGGDLDDRLWLRGTRDDGVTVLAGTAQVGARG